MTRPLVSARSLTTTRWVDSPPRGSTAPSTSARQIGNLSFFNSLRFNYYWWVGGSILRERIPFTAFWRGSVEFPTEQTIDVTYVGEGQVSIGQNRLALEPAYDRPTRTRVRMPAGQHNLVVAYKFDDGYRSGMSFEPGPLATFRLTVQHPAGDAPLAPRSAPIIWRTLGRLIDALVLGAGLVLIFLYRRVLGHRWPMLGLAAAAAWLVYVHPFEWRVVT